jgi:hypothetical protein
VRQRIGAHAALPVHWNADDAILAQTKHGKSLEQRGVGFFTDDDSNLGRAKEAVAFDIPARPLKQRMACGC